MQIKKPGIPAAKRHILAHLLLGILLITGITFTAARADLVSTRRSLSATTSYVKEQCNRYARIGLASETKSLMRIMESCKQISYHLKEANGLCTDSAMEGYARSSYVSGIFLLDAKGQVASQYHAEEPASDLLLDALASPALLDTAVWPEKRYAVRLHCPDGSEIDLAATARQDASGIVVAYYHTPLEYIDAFNLSIASLLSGYSTENDGTIVVSSGDTIVASNNPTLIGHSASDIPILRKIRTMPEENKLAHTRQTPSSLSQYFGLMERSRDFYVYSFLPEHSVFSNTPQIFLYSLIGYIILFAGISALRRKMAQRYREEQIQAQQEYAAQLKDTNEQLSIAVAQADRANAAKTSFLSRMSHDIRTPLNGIIGLLEIDAAHPEDTHLVNTNREKMRVAASHLLSLINDILQMSKLESGEITLAREALDLNRLSVEVLTIIEQRAAESGITMTYDPHSDPVTFPWVYGSPLHLRQIFLNIYTNCIKYNKIGGSISTLFTCVNTADTQVTYRWTITDTGIGMSEAFLKHIFDPFAQERADARSIHHGTGLGMTIVKGLIEQMHGTIEVRSQEQVGSTFIITIPFEIAEQATPAEPTTPSTVSTGIQGLSLLLAEDNALNAEIAQILLTDAGASVTTVSNGEQAVEQFRTNPPGTFDAILMDVMMPVMDGLTATGQIRALGRFDARTIPIIAMTANAFAEDARKCLEAGMNAHLAKPLEIDKVIAVISRCTRNTRT